MKLYIITLFTLVAQISTPSLTVHRIEDSRTIDIPENATEAQIFEAVSKAFDVKDPYAVKIIVGGELLNPCSNKDFSGDSVTFIQLTLDCDAEYVFGRIACYNEGLSKRIAVTSPRFPRVQILNRDNLNFNNKRLGNGILERTIPDLFSPEPGGETRLILKFPLFTGANPFFINVFYKSEEENLLYFGLALIGWFREKIEEKLKITRVDYDICKTLRRKVEDLFSWLIVSNDPLSIGLRDEIHSIALKKFYGESPRCFPVIFDRREVIMTVKDLSYFGLI